MKLFTSNYARHSKDPNAVGISAKAPWWYKGKMYYPLAPSWELIKAHKTNKIDNIEYTTQYIELINDRNLNPEKVVNDLGMERLSYAMKSRTTFVTDIL